jgi:transcription-repair coupling factor (superfamily II helicase)
MEETASLSLVASASNLLSKLPQTIASKAEFRACVDSLKEKSGATFDSVWGSACALLTSALVSEFESVLVVVNDAKELDNLIDDLSTFYPFPVERFPACVQGLEVAFQTDFEYGDRLRLTKMLTNRSAGKIIVATVGALLQPLPSRESIKGFSRFVRRDQSLDLTDIQAWFDQNGFHQTTAVELPGEYSLRGGILDVFAPDWVGPVRIELFDDRVESLRRFDGATQRSLAELDEVEITVLNTLDRDRGHLFEFLPEATLVLLHEPEKLNQQAARYIERSSRPDELFSWSEVNEQWAPFSLGSIDTISSGYLGQSWNMPIDSVESFHGDIGELKLQVERLGLTPNGDRCEVIIVAAVEGELQRVAEILGGTSLASQGLLHLCVGSVHAGFRLRQPGIVVVGCDQLFHRTDLRRRGRKRLSKAIDSFLDLREGDLVVHLSHGIARFRGLEILNKEGELTEHLVLEFFGGTKMFVPAAKIDLVQKYIGGTKTRPILAKIGGKQWSKQKSAVESAVMDLASEMIELQAQRDLRPGIAFKRDTEWQHEFEHSFPYHETTDQLSAIAAIKDDMQTPKPMDRLLCGDVGYGKTEVSMRAAFKAVENGYQVAVLAPTTVLVEQHYNNFSERMGEFPLEIRKLSRFCGPKEIKKTIALVAEGKVDIVIGTHRLVSKDVKFFNLGLAIIDEEQRFGVEHKERLKRLCSSVDILTMSATPIPRTLHLSLVGVRDISNLETPPEERLPIETKVTRFSAELIRAAILRELNRGGQIYFVHNRVSDIFAVRDMLADLVPEASYVVGHGQMSDEELEDAMATFIHHRADVLVATTIIESGLDIPNANTMFINLADRYGLSDLHQLRGRVGRFKHQAYCYLLLEPHKHINPTAAKRLQAIETFAEMGAGFAISMRDLEIRGAGNLLGTEQSGHIATVGYELYCHLLEKAVRKLKHQPSRHNIQVEVDLPVSAYLPDEYIADRRQKIDIYRRLTRIDNFNQIDELRNELADRFGKLPESASRLLALAELKLEAAIWLVSAMYLQDKYFVFKFQDRQRFAQLSRIRPAIRLIDDNTAMVTLKSTNFTPEKMLALAKSLLQATP